MVSTPRTSPRSIPHHEATLADRIQAARDAGTAAEADRLCWTLARTAERGVHAEVRALPAWRRAVMERGELVTVGLMGAFKAARKFQPSRGRFTTYARLWIRAELRRETAAQAGLLRLPENAQAILQRLRIQQRKGVTDPGQLAAAVDAPAWVVLCLLQVTAPARSLDAPTEAGEDYSWLPDPGPAPDEALIAGEASAALSTAIAILRDDPDTDTPTLWALSLQPYAVRDPATLAALRQLLEIL